MAKSSTKGRTPSGTMALTWGASTDPGRVRSVNQDSFFADPGRGLFIVSDGMGGEQAGALASEVVVKVLPAIIEQRLGQLKSNPPPTIRTQLRRAICDLSHRLRTESAAHIGLSGMGATAVVALLGRRSVHLAHLGDSRAYIFRQGRLVQLTDDHSVVGILLRQGEITPQQARSHPAQGRLSRFVGMEDEALPDVKTMALHKGDQLLLCSDGLTGLLSDNQIASVISSNLGCQEACQRLVAAANTNGGRDNITAVLLRWR
jgi:PPM family protein phosphatase